MSFTDELRRLVRMIPEPDPDRLHYVVLDHEVPLGGFRIERDESGSCYGVCSPSILDELVHRKPKKGARPELIAATPNFTGIPIYTREELG